MPYKKCFYCFFCKKLEYLRKPSEMNFAFSKKDKTAHWDTKLRFASTMCILLSIQNFVFLTSGKPSDTKKKNLIFFSRFFLRFSHFCHLWWYVSAPSYTFAYEVTKVVWGYQFCQKLIMLLVFLLCLLHFLRSSSGALVDVLGLIYIRRLF